MVGDVPAAVPRGGPQSGLSEAAVSPAATTSAGGISRAGPDVLYRRAQPWVLPVPADLDRPGGVHLLPEPPPSTLVGWRAAARAPLTDVSGADRCVRRR